MKNDNFYIYVLNHQYKYIWYLVPKVASRSLLYWLLNNKYATSKGEHRQHKINTNLHQMYFTFSFCRNPFDRLVSAYFDKVKKQKLRLYYRWKDKDFTTFANDVCEMNINDMDGHILPQSYLIPENIDFLGRFENLKNDYQFITKKLFTTSFDNIHYNASQHMHYMEYYSNSLKYKVYQKYQNDFERFKYNIDE